MPTQWVAIAGAVVAERVVGVAGQSAAMEYGSTGIVPKTEMRMRLAASSIRIRSAAARSVAALVAVALEVCFFEIERLVTEAGGFPLVNERRRRGGGRAVIVVVLPST